MGVIQEEHPRAERKHRTSSVFCHGPESPRESKLQSPTAVTCLHWPPALLVSHLESLPRQITCTRNLISGSALGQSRASTWASTYPFIPPECSCTWVPLPWVPSRCCMGGHGSFARDTRRSAMLQPASHAVDTSHPPFPPTPRSKESNLLEMNKI